MALPSLPDDWNLDQDLLVLMGAGAEKQLESWQKLGLKRGLAIVPEGTPSESIEGIPVARRVEELRPFVWSSNVPFRRISMRLTHAGGIDRDAASKWLSTLGTLAQEHRSFHQTLANLGPLWAGHALQNAAHIAANPMVGDFGVPFRGKPMIVVGAGPSLGKNIHALKAAQGRAVIVAVHRALESLHRAGIVPDLTIAIEPRDVRHQFEDVGIERVAACLMCTAVDPNLQDHGAQRTIYFTSQAREHWILGPQDHDHEVLSLGTVSHSAVNLGKRWGCDPIIMVGQDLAFTDGDVYHREGADGSARIEQGPESGQWVLAGFGAELSKTLQGVEKDWFNVVEVPAVGGGTVMTSTSFDGFRRTLEDMAREWEGQVELINCTEGGADIVGWRNARLADTVAGLGPLGLEVGPHLDACQDPSRVALRGPAIAENVAACRGHLEEVVTLSRACVDLIGRLLKKPSPKVMRKLEPKENRLKAVSKQLPALTLSTHHDITLIASRAKGLSDINDSLRLSLEMYRTIHRHARALLSGRYAEECVYSAHG